MMQEPFRKTRGILDILPFSIVDRVDRDDEIFKRMSGNMMKKKKPHNVLSGLNT